MKNLFLAGVMLVSFGSAMAQETPKTNQSTSTSDTLIQKKSKMEMKNGTASKTDTVKRTHKKTTKTKSTNSGTSPSKNSVSGSTMP